MFFYQAINIWNNINRVLLKSLHGHTNYVFYMVVLHDFTLTSGSDNLTMNIWDIFSGQLLKTLIGHSTKRVLGLAVLSDNTLVIIMLYSTI